MRKESYKFFSSFPGKINKNILKNLTSDELLNLRQGNKFLKELVTEEIFSREGFSDIPYQDALIFSWIDCFLKNGKLPGDASKIFLDSGELNTRKLLKITSLNCNYSMLRQRMLILLLLAFNVEEDSGQVSNKINENSNELFSIIIEFLTRAYTETVSEELTEHILIMLFDFPDIWSDIQLFQLFDTLMLLMSKRDESYIFRIVRIMEKYHHRWTADQNNRIYESLILHLSDKNLVNSFRLLERLPNHWSADQIQHLFSILSSYLVPEDFRLFRDASGILLNLSEYWKKDHLIDLYNKLSPDFRNHSNFLIGLRNHLPLEQKQQLDECILSLLWDTKLCIAVGSVELLTDIMRDWSLERFAQFRDQIIGKLKDKNLEVRQISLILISNISAFCPGEILEQLLSQSIESLDDKSSFVRVSAMQAIYMIKHQGSGCQFNWINLFEKFKKIILSNDDQIISNFIGALPLFVDYWSDAQLNEIFNELILLLKNKKYQNRMFSLDILRGMLPQWSSVQLSIISREVMVLQSDKTEYVMEANLVLMLSLINYLSIDNFSSWYPELMSRLSSKLANQRRDALSVLSKYKNMLTRDQLSEIHNLFLSQLNDQREKVRISAMFGIDEFLNLWSRAQMDQILETYINILNRSTDYRTQDAICSALWSHLDKLTENHITILYDWMLAKVSTEEFFSTNSNVDSESFEAKFVESLSDERKSELYDLLISLVKGGDSMNGDIIIDRLCFYANFSTVSQRRTVALLLIEKNISVYVFSKFLKNVDHFDSDTMEKIAHYLIGKLKVSSEATRDFFQLFPLIKLLIHSNVRMDINEELSGFSENTFAISLFKNLFSLSNEVVELMTSFPSSNFNC